MLFTPILLGASALTMVAAIAVRFRSPRATVESLKAVNNQNAKQVVVRVGDDKYVISLTDVEAGADEAHKANTAVQEAKAKTLFAT